MHKRSDKANSVDEEAVLCRQQLAEKTRFLCVYTPMPASVCVCIYRSQPLSDPSRHICTGISEKPSNILGES